MGSAYEMHLLEKTKRLKFQRDALAAYVRLVISQDAFQHTFFCNLNREEKKRRHYMTGAIGNPVTECTCGYDAAVKVVGEIDGAD